MHVAPTRFLSGSLRPAHVLLLAVAAVLFGGAVTRTDAGAADWDVQKDFSLSGNPNGDWQYGYIAGAEFALYTMAEDTESEDRWRAAHDFYLSAGISSIPTGKPEFILHPGAANEESVARFVAPEAGTFAVEAIFRAAYPPPHTAPTTDVAVRLNGRVLKRGSVADQSGRVVFSRDVDLKAGDRLDFAVGPAGSNTSDSTLVDVSIARGGPATPVGITLRAIANGSGYDLQVKLTSSKLACIKKVEVVVREKGALLKRGKTDNKGVLSVFVRPTKKTSYTAHAPGTGACKATTVADVDVGPRPMGDPDGDGLPDWIEQEAAYKRAGGDPKHKDIWVECDYMKGLRPDTAAFTLAESAFAKAPLTNPDGKPGVTLHVALADEIPFEDQWGNVREQGPDDSAGFKLTRKKLLAARKAHFKKEKYRGHEDYAHYCAFINAIDPTSISGISMDSLDVRGGIVGDMFIVSLGRFDTKGGTKLEQAGTLMHELGHNLGLRHGGDDGQNDEPNYVSVMNYTFQMGFWKKVGSAFKQVEYIDYSRFAAAALNERRLDENAGLTGATAADTAVIKALAPKYRSIFSCPAKADETPALSAFVMDKPVNWDCDRTANETNVTVDLNADDDLTSLDGQTDWDRLVGDGGAIAGIGAAGAGSYLDPNTELTLDTQRELEHAARFMRMR
jgi:hypothetical protein